MIRTLTFLMGVGLLFVVNPATAEPPTVKKNTNDGAEMILVPGGSFQMGANKDELDDQFRRFGYQKDWIKHCLDEIPRHRKVVKSFYIYKYEVTNAQYKKFLDATKHVSPQNWQGKDFPEGKGNHPVVFVSWEDAKAYCKWAGTRLVAEAEWEYAARGPEPKKGEAVRIFPWGRKSDIRLANSASYHAGKDLVTHTGWNNWYKSFDAKIFPLTKPGGSHTGAVSPFGVHDLAGNVWEWTADTYRTHADRDKAVDPNEKRHPVKGGSWANVGVHLRCSDRHPFDPTTRNLYIGFRCAQNQ